MGRMVPGTTRLTRLRNSRVRVRRGRVSNVGSCDCEDVFVVFAAAGVKANLALEVGPFLDLDGSMARPSVEEKVLFSQS